MAGLTVQAQDNGRDLQQFRYPDQRGINQFEALGDNNVTFDGVKVRMGGAFAIQLQGLNHSTGSVLDTLTEIGTNFNLPTANLDMDVALADGMRMHLRTYLSARHHNEAWVKGGYLQIDKLDFIRKDFLKGVMDITTVKVGLMENNYGDYHFRRTDNARAIYNPFVGNLIMDGFTTEAGAEIYVTPGDFLIMFGVTNGKLNQRVTDPGATGPVILGKLGYDKQVNDDLRLRLTTSLYTTGKSAHNYLYSADRAGSRFYLVMDDTGNPTSNFRTGRYDPGFTNEITAVMINPFVQFKGLELLGTVELSSGKAEAEADTRNWTQLAADLLYRFGPTDNLYIGAKYNQAAGEEAFTGNDVTISRIEAGAGWYMTKNVLVKAEYVQQTYDGFDATNILYEGQFDGVMLEAVVSF
ncbi:MAG: hypothetical protein CMI36_12235 [Owenweeksia sp.]|nr:hypothetical protein [Owenweeksia sp.]|tara:strand:+ start:484 stop:1713 length:1230 start_codon:yes stop_codon:yes gene_type:complete